MHASQKYGNEYLRKESIDRMNNIHTENQSHQLCYKYTMFHYKLNQILIFTIIKKDDTIIEILNEISLVHVKYKDFANAGTTQLSNQRFAYKVTTFQNMEYQVEHCLNVEGGYFKRLPRCRYKQHTAKVFLENFVKISIFVEIWRWHT